MRRLEMEEAIPYPFSSLKVCQNYDKKSAKFGSRCQGRTSCASTGSSWSSTTSGSSPSRWSCGSRRCGRRSSRKTSGSIVRSTWKKRFGLILSQIRGKIVHNLDSFLMHSKYRSEIHQNFWTSELVSGASARSTMFGSWRTASSSWTMSWLPTTLAVAMEESYDLSSSVLGNLYTLDIWTTDRTFCMGQIRVSDHSDAKYEILSRNVITRSKF